MSLTLDQKRELIALYEEKERRKRTSKLWSYFPDKGEFRRELYPKHIMFFEAGKIHNERLMLAANRVGKTESVGGFETTLHLTGLYPDWWEGRRFDFPISAWAAGDTSQTVRDIIQKKLLGNPGSFGTGLIPSDCIIKTRPKAGSIPDAIETVHVKHISGGTSFLTFKSYDQKRKSFQGTEQHVIWMDEEPPKDIYVECLLRTMTTNGLILCTFTPLLGISDVVMMYCPGGKIPKDGLVEEAEMAQEDTYF